MVTEALIRRLDTGEAVSLTCIQGRACAVSGADLPHWFWGYNLDVPVTVNGRRVHGATFNECTGVATIELGEVQAQTA